MSSYFFDSQLAKGKPEDYVTDKERSVKTFMNYMNIRLQKMFHYGNLPDSLPKEMLEYYLVNNGCCFITEAKGNLYAFTGSFGGPPDAYYRPTLYVVANPGLELSESYNIATDGVLIRNDTLWVGLHPLMSRYAVLLAENLITLRSADIMLRILALFTAPDDATKVAAEAYLKNLEEGKLGVIGENRFMDEGVKMQSPPSNNGSYLTQFIELHQYLTGTFYNEIGLNANFNMKRESIGEGESSLNEDSLLPLCEDMLRCRKEDLVKVNAMFGTNITIEFDSAWAENEKRIALELEKLKNEASQLAEGGDENGEGNTGESDESYATISEDDKPDEDDSEGGSDTSDTFSNGERDRSGSGDLDGTGGDGNVIHNNDGNEEAAGNADVEININIGKE